MKEYKTQVKLLLFRLVNSIKILTKTVNDNAAYKKYKENVFQPSYLRVTVYEDLFNLIEGRRERYVVILNAWKKHLALFCTAKLSEELTKSKTLLKLLASKNADVIVYFLDLASEIDHKICRTRFRLLVVQRTDDGRLSVRRAVRVRVRVRKTSEESGRRHHRSLLGNRTSNGYRTG
jgi:hypothetical protein